MSKFKNSTGYKIIENWMRQNEWQPFDFQYKTWSKYYTKHSGLVVAPTGFGKTFSVFLAVVIDYLNHPETYKKGLSQSNDKCG